MTYIRLSLVLESHALSVYERLFEDEALSIVISPVSNEVVIAADLPGENIPIDWREVKLTAYLPLGTDLERLDNLLIQPYGSYDPRGTSDERVAAI